MTFHTLDEVDPISVTSFSSAFKLACDTNEKLWGGRQVAILPPHEALVRCRTEYTLVFET